MSIYGCYNKPRIISWAAIEVQDGYHTTMFEYESGTSDRIDRIVQVPFAMSTECQYTKTNAADRLCNGCKHQSKDQP